MKARYFPGKEIGRLRLVEKRQDKWLCRCSCGKEPAFFEADLVKVRSCGCIVILGLDLATTSGWAVRYSWRDPSAIKCGVFYVGKNDAGEEVSWEEKYALAANHVYKLLREHKPDFVCIEQPEHNIRKFGKKETGAKGVDIGAVKAFIGRLSAVMFKHGLHSAQAAQVVAGIGGGTSNSNQMQLSGIVGAVVGVCMNMGTPYGTIGSRSWHSIYYRNGTKPADGKDWKDIAIETCELEHIPLPSTKKDQRDAAEAVGIAGCWHKADLPNFKWVHDRHIALRTNAAVQLAAKRGAVPDQTPSKDLFSGATA